jgi:imidazolonepropionase
MLNMACTLFRLTPEEALRGMTTAGALALGLADRGRLIPGQRADFVAWPHDHPSQLTYAVGQHPAARIIVGGLEVTP